MFNLYVGVAMNIKQGSMILLAASMISISILASEEVSIVDQPINVDEQAVTKDAKDAMVQVATENVALPSTIDQIRELISEWSTWAWNEGIQEHPYISAGCGLSAVLLVYLLTSKVYRDAVIQGNNNDERNTKPKGCCRKKRQEAEAVVETATEVIASTLQEETTQPAAEITPASEATTETVAVVMNETAAPVEATEVERVLTSKEVCEEHGCACLVNGRCPCEKDERGSCSCCHKKMKQLRECKQSRSRWQEEATEVFLKKILVAMREYKAAINWAQ
jgi:hypothetical protein